MSADTMLWLCLVGFASFCIESSLNLPTKKFPQRDAQYPVELSIDRCEDKQISHEVAFCPERTKRSSGSCVVEFEISSMNGTTYCHDNLDDLVINCLVDSEHSAQCKCLFNSDEPSGQFCRIYATSS